MEAATPNTLVGRGWFSHRRLGVILRRLGRFRPRMGGLILRLGYVAIGVTIGAFVAGGAVAIGQTRVSAQQPQAPTTAPTAMGAGDGRCVIQAPPSA